MEYFNFLQQNKSARCVSCSAVVSFIVESELPDTGTFARCLHLICGSCARLSRTRQIIASNQVKCVVCGLKIYSSPQCLHAVSPSPLARYPSPMDPAPSPSSETTYSTKFRALLNNISAHTPQEKRYRHYQVLKFEFNPDASLVLCFRPGFKVWISPPRCYNEKKLALLGFKAPC